MGSQMYLTVVHMAMIWSYTQTKFGHAHGHDLVIHMGIFSSCSQILFSQTHGHILVIHADMMYNRTHQHVLDKHIAVSFKTTTTSATTNNVVSAAALLKSIAILSPRMVCSCLLKWQWRLCTGLHRAHKLSLGLNSVNFQKSTHREPMTNKNNNRAKPPPLPLSLTSPGDKKQQQPSSTAASA